MALGAVPGALVVPRALCVGAECADLYLLPHTTVGRRSHQLARQLGVGRLEARAGPTKPVSPRIVIRILATGLPRRSA